MRKTNELRCSSTCDRPNVCRFAEFVGAGRTAPDRRKALIGLAVASGGKAGIRQGNRRGCRDLIGVSEDLQSGHIPLPQSSSRRSNIGEETIDVGTQDGGLTA